VESQDLWHDAVPVFIPRETNVDIDYPEDWAAAEILHRVIEEKALGYGGSVAEENARGGGRGDDSWMNNTFLNVALPWLLTGISVSALYSSWHLRKP